MSMQKGLKTGLIAFALLTYLILIGTPQRLAGAAFPMLALVAGVLIFGSVRRDAVSKPASQVLVNGLVAGLVSGMLTAGLLLFFGTLMGRGVNIQPVLDKMVPANLAALSGLSPDGVQAGALSLIVLVPRIVLVVLVGLLGTGLALALSSGAVRRWRASLNLSAARWLIIALPFVLLAVVVWMGDPAVKLGGTSKGTLRLLVALIATGSGLFALRQTRPGREQRVVAVLLAAGTVLLPFTLDQFQNSVMGIVFIFVMMGLGLNIVVGFAGLLDLGYVAFFAIGAYLYGLLSTPASSTFMTTLLAGAGGTPNPVVNFWMAIPLSMLAGALGGILLGIPVLRLRGDYLAIVTLGFGEIIRLFLLNLEDVTNGPRGLLKVAHPTLFGVDLGNPRDVFILALIGSALVAFVATRLNDSRLGRAWVALREDEDVAQATGIHLVRTKLLAFAFGAMFAGLAGQLYAARQTNIFPDNFSLFVSIDALALIIVGGMGSLPGVVLGAIALKGLPEVLRGVDEYRILTFAALLVVMMIARPEGLLPSSRRRRELHEADTSLEEAT
ncbi:MAG: hypothetical protein M5U01_36300 [Ardenticatenaceae bacterium]|nr:hypothetical protein [Ardenticatenaceae bacterium]HBY99139.1 leucine/isoleucine/valine transporter permease subunit [Chloroflexota bacterium]